MGVPAKLDGAALAALTDGEIADRWGKLKQAGDAYSERIEGLKAEFNRRKLDFAKGERFKVIKDVASQIRLDVKAVRAHLGAAAKKFEQAQSRTEYRVREVEAAA